MKRVAVLAVLLLAGPSAGGDLVRYRAADGTINRGRDAARRIDRAEERFAQAEEWYDRCDDGGIANYCSRSSLEAAEREVESAQEALADLEQDCRRSGCDPGWLRCAP